MNQMNSCSYTFDMNFELKVDCDKYLVILNECKKKILSIMLTQTVLLKGSFSCRLHTHYRVGHFHDTLSRSSSSKSKEQKC